MAHGQAHLAMDWLCPIRHNAKMSTGEEERRKPLVFLEGAIKTPPFTSEGREEAGTRLREIQEGESLGMPISRPMPSIGPRVHELRIRDQIASLKGGSRGSRIPHFSQIKLKATTFPVRWSYLGPQLADRLPDRSRPHPDRRRVRQDDGADPEAGHRPVREAAEGV